MLLSNNALSCVLKGLGNMCLFSSSIKKTMETIICHNQLCLFFYIYVYNYIRIYLCNINQGYISNCHKLDI